MQREWFSLPTKERGIRLVGQDLKPNFERKTFLSNTWFIKHSSSFRSQNQYNQRPLSLIDQKESVYDGLPTIFRPFNYNYKSVAIFPTMFKNKSILSKNGTLDFFSCLLLHFMDRFRALANLQEVLINSVTSWANPMQSQRTQYILYLCIYQKMFNEKMYHHRKKLWSFSLCWPNHFTQIHSENVKD